MLLRHLMGLNECVYTGATFFTVVFRRANTLLHLKSPSPSLTSLLL